MAHRQPPETAAFMITQYGSVDKAKEMAHLHGINNKPESVNRKYWKEVELEIELLDKKMNKSREDRHAK